MKAAAVKPGVMNQERLMQVLLAPVVSEKSTFVADKNEQVIFRVVVGCNQARDQGRGGTDVQGRRSTASRWPTSRARKSASAASSAAAATGRRRTCA